MIEKLSKSEDIRYSRHLKISDIGMAGQLKLKAASVLIVGCGGLGSSSALYLAAAGIGKIGLVDSDVVELSNLQRQVIHNMDSINSPKVDSAKKRMEFLNPNVMVEVFHTRIRADNIDHILGDYSIIVDATDNFETRYILNTVCVSVGIPFVYGAIYQFSGQLSVFNYQNGPCFQCVFQHKPSKDFIKANRGVGVVGALPGVIGALQAIEVIKLIIGIGKILSGRMLILDGLDMFFREISIKRNQTCSVCSL